MTFFIILITVLVVWMIFGERIKAWLQRFMIRRMEDAIRRQMGMPSRKEQEKARRQAEKEARKGSSKSSRAYASAGASGGSTASAYAAPTGHIIPPEYAEDVEYTEYREYSESIDIRAERQPDGRTRLTVESQVSDAEYIEIKG